MVTGASAAADDPGACTATFGGPPRSTSWPLSPDSAGSAPTVAAKVPNATAMATMTTADRARRGDRSRTPRRIGSSTNVCVAHDSATTTTSRNPSNDTPDRFVRSWVTTR